MPRHFSKMMQNPYFHTDHYKNESVGGKLEAKIEKKFDSIINRFKFWRGRK